MTGLTATTGNFSSTVTATGGAAIVSDTILPSADSAGTIGSAAPRAFLNLFVHNAYKDGGGTWGTLSDARTKYKTDKPFTDGLQVLLQMQPVTYKYNGQYGTPKDKEFVGFRAEPLLEIAPQMVGTLKIKKTGKDSDPEEDIFTVNTSELDYILLNAIKELHARVSILEAQ
jgi:hypothetical protein